MAADEFLGPLNLRRTQHAKLTAELRTVQERCSSLARSIDDHRRHDVGADRKSITALEAKLSALAGTIALQEAAKEALDAGAKAARASQVNLLQFRRFFSVEQKQLRVEDRRLREQLSKALEDISKSKAALARTTEAKVATTTRLLAYDAFNAEQVSIQLREAEAEAQRIVALQAPLADEIQRMEAQVRPQLEEYRRLRAKVAATSADIQAATRFDEQLRNAANGAERARIHQECEAKFGTGKPGQVIRDRSAQKLPLEKNVQKIERRIHAELQKLDRVIEHLIIDGNNICYEGQKFIGFGALQALLGQVQDRFRITVIFDASIRRLMQTDDQGIALRLGERCTPRVSPTRSSADEYLMKVAGEAPGSFILSNDRFAEFQDYDVVRSGRVLRFMVADGRLMVNDLDVTTDFSLAPSPAA